MAVRLGNEHWRTLVTIFHFYSAEARLLAGLQVLFLQNFFRWRADGSVTLDDQASVRSLC
jgi:hypothetical protein